MTPLPRRTTLGKDAVRRARRTDDPGETMRRSSACKAMTTVLLLCASAAACGCGHYGEPSRGGARVSAGGPVLVEGSATAPDEECEEESK
jgi:hypothetical protein